MPDLPVPRLDDDTAVDRSQEREPLRLTVSPGSMTPGPSGGAAEKSTGQIDSSFEPARSLRPLKRPQELLSVKSDEDYEKVPEGATFVDPEGKQRVKPFVVLDDEDYEKVLEGAQFTGPDGGLRKKPKFEGIGFTAQMLYSMAYSDEQRKEVLEKFYPGLVQQDTEGLYVEDGKTFRRPGHGSVGSRLGIAAAETAPAAGMTVGGMIGAPAGGVAGTFVEPGGGTVLGAASGGAAGMVGGAMLGRQFNNLVLSLAGIHQTPEESAVKVGMEGLGAGLGAGAGKALGAIVKNVPGGLKTVVDAAKGVKTWKEASGTLGRKLVDALEAAGLTPEKVRSLLGTSPEAAERSARIANVSDRGAPPSAYALESPFLHKLEEFDLMFRKQDVFGQAARDYYEKQGAELLANEDIGVTLDTPLTRATKRVSSQKAGQLVIEAARLDLAITDAEMESAWREARTSYDRMVTGAGGPENVRTDYRRAVEKLRAVQAREKEAASALVHEGIRDIRRTADHVLDEIKANENPGELARVTGSQFSSWREAIRVRARKLYNAADAAGGETPIDTSPLFDDAKMFLERVPEAMKQKYPEDIRLIAKMAGKEAQEGVEAIEPTHLTFKEMHLLRSWLRHGIDYADLTPDMRQGSLKLFEGKANKLLHDADAAPHLKEAAELLDRADAFYKKEIPFFNDEIVRNVMKSLESGAPPDPHVIAEYLLAPERTEAMARARKIVGEGTWKYVQAADTQRMIQNSLDLEPGKIDADRFASQVEERVRNGVLSKAYDPAFAKQVLQAALNVVRAKGALPIRAEENDTLASIMRRAEIAAQEADKLASTDPLKALSNEVSRVDKAYNQRVKEALESRRQDPLRFLTEESHSKLFVKAANKIISSPDLLVAAAAKFGRDSPEFKALQQVAAHRWFQRPLEKTGNMFLELGGEKGKSEEELALLFPGVTRDQMLTIVKDMEFLFSGASGDMGGSLAGASRVISPWNSLPIPKPSWMRKMLDWPGANTVGRLVYGRYLATIMDAVSHPDFANWLASNLSKGPAERDAARQVLQRRLKLGGWFGAAGGQLATQNAQ